MDADKAFALNLCESAFINCASATGATRVDSLNLHYDLIDTNQTNAIYAIVSLTTSGSRPWKPSFQRNLPPGLHPFHYQSLDMGEGLDLAGGRSNRRLCTSLPNDSSQTRL